MPSSHTSDRSFQCRPYVASDRSSALDLLQRHFPDVNSDWFGWKFEGDVSLPRVLVVAERDDRVVGFLSWTAREFHFEGNRTIGMLGGDAAIDVDHRNSGVFSQMLRDGHAILKEQPAADFIYGTVVRDASSLPGLLLAGYRPVCELHWRIRSLLRIPHRRPERRKVSILSVEAPVSEAILRSAHSSAFLAWRYDHHPLFSYYSVDYGNHVAVFRRGRLRRIPVVFHMHSIATKTTDCHASLAIDALARSQAMRGVALLSLTAGKTDIGSLTKPRRFGRPVSRLLLVRNLSGRIPDTILSDPGCWPICAGITDSL